MNTPETTHPRPCCTHMGTWQADGAELTAPGPFAPLSLITAYQFYAAERANVEELMNRVWTPAGLKQAIERFDETTASTANSADHLYVAVAAQPQDFGTLRSRGFFFRKTLPEAREAARKLPEAFARYDRAAAAYKSERAAYQTRRDSFEGFIHGATVL